MAIREDSSQSPDKVTSSWGTLDRSKEFVEAARTLYPPFQSFPYNFPSVVYLLVGHSIELSLKAFLMGRGTTAEELRSKYGHDLDRLLGEAERRGLDDVLEVKLSAADIRAICLLNVEYKSKGF